MTTTLETQADRARRHGCCFESLTNPDDSCLLPVVGLMIEEGNDDRDVLVEVCEHHMRQWYADPTRRRRGRSVSDLRAALANARTDPVVELLGIPLAQAQADRREAIATLEQQIAARQAEEQARTWTVGAALPSVSSGAFPREQATGMVDWVDTALWALARLHGGEWLLNEQRDETTLAELYTAISDLTVRLLPRLEGLRDALIRAHRQAGGSYGELATAMDVRRATAQTRAVKVQSRRTPGAWEAWASGPPQTTITADLVRPGDTLIGADGLLHGEPACDQVHEVTIWPEDTSHSHAVEIGAGRGSLSCDRDTLITVVQRDNPRAWTESSAPSPAAPADETITIFSQCAGHPRDSRYTFTLGFLGEGESEPQTLHAEGDYATWRRLHRAYTATRDLSPEGLTAIWAVGVDARLSPESDLLPRVLNPARIQWLDGPTLID